MNTNDYLRDSIPNDHCRQTDAAAMVVAYVEKHKAPSQIIDLGCGDGRSVEMFLEIVPEARWIGIDIQHSKEVSRRQRLDAHFITYDGINIPIETSSQELIYSNQVLEHVRYPEALLADVRRCLAPTGVFIGQTSHLEPYHSHSFWNFTPYGFKRISEDAGLVVLELRPGIDGIALCERSASIDRRAHNQWFKEESPLNKSIEEKGRIEGVSIRTINARKLMLCGQFSFICMPTA